MRGLGETLARLSAHRKRLASLLSAPQKAQPSQASARPIQLREIPRFGTNPGNLRMFVYEPLRLPPRPALVVAMHGCTQTACGYATGTGWSMLADQAGFVVLYPEQLRDNNPQTCFSWFIPGDIDRNQGEALSIRQMIGYAVSTLGVDAARVFVTGLSAGGAMTSVMLATYPELFAGGTIIAGLPYGCASSLEEAYAAMFSDKASLDAGLADKVRSASDHKGPWPRISVWHGASDKIVRPSNAEAIIRQWTTLHELPSAPSRREIVSGQSRRIWTGAHGQPLVEAFTIEGMDHGVPLAPGAAAGSVGVAGPFFLDVNLSSTQHIASFWGLHELPSAAWQATPAAAAHVFAAEREVPSLAPGPIIEAALRAAGLIRR
jgi:feruloyl esterase